MPMEIREATQTDAGPVAACVCHAFIHYIADIGKQPQPMLDDYQALIAAGQVFVAVHEGAIAGVLVIGEDADGFCIETLATHPQQQGNGIGKALIAYAEAVARKNNASSIYLSTNSIMHQSQHIYRHLGFVEFDRRVVNGYNRIFMRKLFA